MVKATAIPTAVTVTAMTRHPVFGNTGCLALHQISGPISGGQRAMSALLRLLQLTSPALPVGAYSYSEGLEQAVDRGLITSASQLQDWLIQDLNHGGIRIEGAVLGRVYRAIETGDQAGLRHWNQWLSASRETEELRNQSWQMGRSLLRLVADLHGPQGAIAAIDDRDLQPCNFAVAFGIVAHYWQIPIEEALLGYLQSWASNLISAGIKLIPLGQTAGQQLQLDLSPAILAASQVIPSLADRDLRSSNWGVVLASMGHETQYSRLFRS
jgi:urease accessory protein